MTRLRPRRLARVAVTALVFAGAVSVQAPSAQAAGSGQGSWERDSLPRISVRVEVPEEKLDRARADARAGGRSAPRLDMAERTTVAKPGPGLSLSQAAEVAARNAITQQANEPAATLAPTPIGEQPPGALLNECFNAGGADKGIGRVHNRFTYCHRMRITVGYYSISPNRPPEHEGDTHATLEVFAQGDNKDRRVRVFSRIQPGSVDYEWGPYDDLFVAPDVPLSLLGQCFESAERCYATRGAPTLPWTSWDNNDDWFYWDVINKEEHTQGRDKVAEMGWHVEFFTEDGEYTTVQRGKTGTRLSRCDSATYFNNRTGNDPKACVFWEVAPRLTYRLGSKAHGVADHILRAQKTPNETYPLLVPQGTPPPRDKRTPGMYDADNPNAPGLHRITETLHPGEYLNNRNHKDGACYRTGPERDLYYDTGLPRPPLSGIEQCDEYPFASTLEGAGHPEWDFSVMAVPQSDNASGGGQLVTFYHEDRVLAWDYGLPEDINDEFWVEITAPCGGCGGPGEPVPPGNVAPSVDAGPDASGPEGSGIALTGTVTDPDDTPEITWSYRLGATADPGMVCQFSSPGQTATTIRCTDDGTVTVTLAADDHHRDGPVTDTATVTVTNAAPAVRIDSPQPEQLFNGREPTPVTAGFTDRGTNDTHTCELDFGDGSPPVRGTVQAQACTGSHTYGYDGLGPRTITVTVTDDDGGATSQSVPVVIYVPGSGYGAHVSGLISVPRSPNVHCPPSDTQSTATLRTLVGTIDALTVACHLDTKQGRTTVDTSVAGASLLGGAVRITDIESKCTAGADGITRTSRVGTINGVPIGSGRGSLSVAGVATISYNETATNARGQLVQNAVRVTTPVQEIILANCTLG